MKKITHLIILFLITFSVNSCENDKDGDSILTKPAILTLNGESTIYLVPGDVYDEEGVLVTGGSLVKTVGMVNTDRPGTYSIKYIAENSEGAFTYAERTVIVLELGDGSVDLSGTYAGTRGSRGGGDVTLTQVATGIYEVSDYFAGYYEVVAGYGELYRGPGLLRYEGDGVFVMPVPATSVWGNLYLKNDEGTVDVANGVISYKMYMDDGFDFAGERFTLTKK